MCRAWVIACLLALRWAQATVGEPCAGDDGACPSDEASRDTSALLQTPKHRHTARARTGIVEMDATNSSKPTKRRGVPERKLKPESLHDCQELTALLRSVPDLDEVESLWRYMCRDESRDRLSELKDGCLYVPVDKYISTLYETVDHLNPWHFFDMLEDSFFPAKGLPCPTEVRGVKALTGQGAAVMSCSSGPGFQGVDSHCVSTSFVGQTSVEKSNVRVYRMEGLMGLDETWQEMLTSAGEQRTVQDPDNKLGNKKGGKYSFWPFSFFRKLKRNLKKIFGGKGKGNGGGGGGANSNGQASGSAPAAPPAVQMRIRYYVCDPGDGSIDRRVTDKMLADQTAVLNKAYSGRDKCAGSLAYGPSFTDTGFRFVEDGIVRLTDPDCASDCSERIPQLTSKFARREDGLIKVVLCDTQLLGIASFPGYPESSRACLINYNTLPGGAMTSYNLGKTLTHELGHYLGSYHTFQGGCDGDGIADTNAEKEPNFGCPGYRATKTCGNSVDPVHNFMDYSDDRCMCSFTRGQTENMWDDLRRYQPDLLTVPVRAPAPVAPAPVAP